MSENVRFNDENVETTYALSPIPEGIEQYAGQWVAIRGRQVIVAAESFDDVVGSDVFDQTTDALYHVPTPGYHYYRAA